MANAANEQQVKEMQEKEKSREMKLVDDLKFILDTPQGVNVVCNIIQWAGIYQTTFTGDQRSGFREGRRDLGLQLLSYIKQANRKVFVDLHDFDEQHYKHGGKHGTSNGAK